MLRRHCYLLGLSSLLAFVIRSQSKRCNCSVLSPKTRFCNADFVGRVKLLGMVRKEEGNVERIIYTTSVTKSYKGVNPKGSRTIAVHSILNDCGVVLVRSKSIGSEYLLSAKYNAKAGYRLETTDCDWHIGWRQLDKDIKNSLLKWNAVISIDKKRPSFCTDDDVHRQQADERTKKTTMTDDMKSLRNAANNGAISTTNRLFFNRLSLATAVAFLTSLLTRIQMLNW